MEDVKVSPILVRVRLIRSTWELGSAPRVLSQEVSFFDVGGGENKCTFLKETYLDRGVAHGFLAVVLDGGAHRVLEDLEEDVVEMRGDVHTPEKLEQIFESCAYDESLHSFRCHQSTVRIK